MLSSLYLKGIVAMFVLGSVFGIYKLAESKLSELEQVKIEKRIAQEQVKLLAESMVTYKQSVDQQILDYNKGTDKLNRDYTDSRRKVDELEKLLSKHDMEKLAKRKPEMLARKLNAATSKLFLDLERVTAVSR